jgi:hypothetical protein
MKTMFLTLAAVLGIALGTASLTPAAYAATAAVQQPIDAPNWG